MLNKALEFQKNKDFTNARLKYNELGRIEVVQMLNISNNPTINRLKYLYYRNRGMLRLRELIDKFNEKEKKKLHNEEQIDKINEKLIVNYNNSSTKNGAHDNSSNNNNNDNDNDNIILISDVDDSNVLNDDNDEIEVSKYGEILGSMNDLLNAILYGEPDEKIVQILASLFEHFKYSRLARLAYELKIGNSDDFRSTNEDFFKIDLNHPNSLFVNQKKILFEYMNLLKCISDDDTKTFKQIKQCLNHTTFINDVTNKNNLKKYNWNDLLSFDEWKNERHHELEELIINVDVKNNKVDVNSLLDSIVNCLPKPKGRSKVYDGYMLTDEHIDKIRFEFDVIVNDEKSEKEEKKTIPEHRTKRDSITEENEQQNNKASNEDQLNLSAGTEKPISRSVRNLRTKPEPESNDHAKTILKNYDIFISQTLPSFLQLCNVKLQNQPLSGMILTKDLSTLTNTDPNIIKFYSCINNWNDEYTQCLGINDKHGKNSFSGNESVRELLNIKSFKSLLHHQFEEIDDSYLFALLKSMDANKPHFNQIRMKIVEHFCHLDEKTKNSIICVNPMSKKSLKNFKIIVDSVSISYYNNFEKLIFYSKKSLKIFKELNIVISIYEILVHSYLEFIKEQKLRKVTNKQTQTDYVNSESVLLKRLDKWNQLIEDAFSVYNYKDSEDLRLLWCRFKWFKLYYLQACPRDINAPKLIQILKELSFVVKDQDYFIPYVNYDLISVLNYENIQTQFSKLKILEIFDTNEKSNQILESVLLGTPLDDQLNNEIKKQFVDFVETANLPMLLRLWSLLLRYYRISNDITKYKLAFERIILIMMNEIKPENNKNLSDYQFKIKLLNVIGFFTYFSLKFIQFCDITNFTCFNENDHKISRELVSSIAYLLYMLYSFLMYQKAVQIDGRISMSIKSIKSFEILNDCISSSFFLLSAYFPSALEHPKPEIINDFFSVCHIELGLRHMCSSINGSFLKYLQYKLSTLDFKISADDVFQIIHCRFGLSISLDGFETFDHRCRPKKLTMEDAIQLSKYVSTYCFRGKHPVISPPRNDIKSIIDKIVDVFGTSGITDPIALSNKSVYHDYLLNKDIDLNFIIDALHGKIKLDLNKPNFIGIEIAENGLYYLEGLIGLHFFKVRKRTIQSRASELDYVLKMLENDVLCGCNRFETWVALGQTYSFLVEDDLIWTADKLNSYERKQATALTQKKALLCYFMAVSIYFKSDDGEKSRVQPVLFSLWESFAKELYCSWMEPMNKKAFHTFVDANAELSLKSVGENPKYLTLKAHPNNLPNNAIFKLLELLFKQALKEDNTNWYDLMFLVKSQNKIQYQPKDTTQMIKDLLLACDLAIKQSNKEDPIMEPHYYLFTTVKKIFKESKITLTQAIEFLEKDQLFNNIFKQSKGDLTFDDITFMVLKKIISNDKKKWQHRPIYRLAKAYYDLLHDVEHAKEEMSTIVNLKPNVRSLSTIWKPLSERPGKHFIYNSTYTQFMVQLLYETGDIYSLTVLLKKMRRAGSIMVNLSKTFDSMTLRICTLIKKSLNLEPNFLDEALFKIRYSDFVKYSNEFIQQLKQTVTFNSDTLLHLFFLSETQAFRKLATGFGATGLIDECYHSIYVKMFIPFLFKKIVEDKGKGMRVSDLLEKSKNFSIDKLSKSKQSTPEVSVRNEESHAEINEISFSTDETTANNNILNLLISDQNNTPNNVNTGSLSEIELNWKDKCLIIGYLSFGMYLATGTPNKEKTKTARRDVSPYALKLVAVTQTSIEEFRQKTNDGETIDYHISGPLDDTEFERAIAGVNAKETKENKEDKEFEKLISAHDRSFSEKELKDFNEILDTFGVERLTNFQTKSELDQLKNTENEKREETERKTQLENLRATISRDLSVPLVEMTESNDLPSPSLTPLFADSGIKRPLSQECSDSILDPFISPKKQKLASIDVQENIIVEPNIGMLKETEEKDKEKGEKEVSRVSKQSEITSYFKKSPSKSPSKDLLTKTPLESVNLATDPTTESVNLSTNSSTKIDSPLRSEEPMNKRRLESENADKLFFRTKDESSFKKLKLSDDNDFDRCKVSSNIRSAIEHRSSQIKDPERRNSRRGVGSTTLLELGKSGHVKEQIDVKQRRERSLLETAEVLTSSESEDSIIIID
jgi:hypothetical protein